MEYSELVTALKVSAERLSEGRVSEVDFEQLVACLSNASSALESLSQQAERADRLVALFKKELSRKAQAVARLTGRRADLLQRMIYSKNVTLAELLSLKQEIDNEFDQSFSRKLSEPTGAAGGGERVAEFKV